tara:strand:+ start:6393 stop:7130 length:738 start_codon:yes stop_codon:yes gene_type:complete
MKKLVLLFTLASIGTASAENIYDGTGPLSDAVNWSDATLPTPYAVGVVKTVNGAASGNVWDHLGVLQTGGTLVDYEDRGLFLLNATVYTINDSRTNYNAYTNMDISGTLKFWSDKSKPISKLRILSGTVKASKMALVKGYIGIKNGILHVDELTGSVAATITFKNDGKGTITIEDKGEVNLAQLFLSFEKKSQCSFTIGQQEGSTFSDIQWLIKNGRVSIGGEKVTSLESFKITRRGTKTTLALP